MGNLSSSLKQAQALAELLPGTVGLKFNGPEFDKVKTDLGKFASKLAVEVGINTVEEMPSLEAVLITLLDVSPKSEVEAANPMISQWLEKVLAKPRVKAVGEGDGDGAARTGSRKAKPKRK